MKKLFSFLKLDVLKRLVTFAFIAGFMIVTTTACSSPDMTATNAPADADAGSPTTEYGNKPKAKFEGGMNKYSDVDPRRDTTAVEIKTKSMVEKAKRQINQDTNPLDEVKSALDQQNIAEKVEKLPGQLSRSAQEKVDETLSNAQQGLENVSNRTQSLKQEVASTAKDVSKQVQSATTEAKQNVQGAVNKLADDARG